MAALCAESKELALIGDDKTCALLTVELSGDEDIQLLERAEIDKVLKEHKLSENKLAATQLVKLFPHVDVFAVIRDKRLIVFNAKNGFRLMDANAAKIPELAELIRLAVKKLAVKNPVYISIVSVRDVGVPRRYKPKINEFIQTFEQELMKQPDIQMLERSHLALVNEERELTEKRYDLKASARLLTLEFEPGSEANIVKVKLLIRNLANELTGTAKILDGFKHIPQVVADLSKKTLLVLGKSLSVSVEARREAQRFFREYQRLVKSQGSGQAGEIRKYKDAGDKLFSALALAPGDKNIRFAELIYYSKMLRALPLDRKIPAIREQLQRAKKFRADFGFCRPSVFEPDVICGGILTNYAAKWTPEFQKQYILICREFRPLLVNDIRTLYYPYNLNDGINSLKELRNFTDVVIRSNWCYRYGNQREWLKQRLADYTLLYKKAAEYIAAHPQDTGKVNQIIRESYLPDIFYPNQRVLDLPVLAEHLEQTRELCKFVAVSKLDSIKPSIFQLDAMRAAIREKTEENFSRAIDQYFECLAAVNPELLRPPQNIRQSSLSLYRLRDFCGKIIKQYDLPNQRLNAYRQKHRMSSEFADLERLVMMFLHGKAKVAFPDIAKKVSSMKKFNLQHLKSNNFGNAYGAVIEYVFANDARGKSINSEKLDFFFKVNSDFTITTRPYYEFPGMTGTGVRLRGAAENSGEIALFFDNRQTFILKTGCAPLRLPTPSEALLIPYRRNSEWKRPLTLSDSHLAFVDVKHNLHIYDRVAHSWRIVEDFYKEPVRSLLIYRKKIYALAGDEEWAVHNRRNYMFSCSLNGSGRQILFSSERSEKLTELDKLRGGLSSLMAIGGNKLAFLLTYTNAYTQVWQYDIGQNSFARLFKTPYPGTDTDVMWQGRDKTLYLASCGWSERLYRFKPDKYRPEWIFCQSGGKRKFDAPDDKPAFFNGRSQLRPPWRVSGNYLWSGGETSALLDLNNIEANPPLLLLPRTRYVYELGDREMIFFGDYRYFTVRFTGRREKSADE